MRCETWTSAVFISVIMGGGGVFGTGLGVCPSFFGDGVEEVIGKLAGPDRRWLS